jgi:hypothetical protein
VWMKRRNKPFLSCRNIENDGVNGYCEPPFEKGFVTLTITSSEEVYKWNRSSPSPTGRLMASKTDNQLGEAEGMVQARKYGIYFLRVPSMLSFRGLHV